MRSSSAYPQTGSLYLFVSSQISGIQTGFKSGTEASPLKVAEKVSSVVSVLQQESWFSLQSPGNFLSYYPSFSAFSCMKTQRCPQPLHRRVLKRLQIPSLPSFQWIIDPAFTGRVPAWQQASTSPAFFCWKWYYLPVDFFWTILSLPSHRWVLEKPASIIPKTDPWQLYNRRIHGSTSPVNLPSTQNTLKSNRVRPFLHYCMNVLLRRG